jgi:SAM-dependent methyltransferase
VSQNRMTSATDIWIARHYPSDQHPYRVLEREVLKHVSPKCVLLDAGCGHTAPLATRLAAHVGRAIGIDVGPADAPGIECVQANLSKTGLPGESVDLIVSRSVLEHLPAPLDTFRELHRVLRPGGRFVFLTPSRWDYASIAALAIPDRLHPSLVRRLTDRKESDTFPTFYRVNTNRAIRRIAVHSGFEVESLRYLNQYPDYFRKIPPLFLLGVAYERITSSWPALERLRGWILGTLMRPQ